LSTVVWLAVLEELEKPNKRSLDEDEATDISGVGEKERPIGTKQAKKQRNGKGGVKDDDVSLDEDLKKFSDIEAATKKDRKTSWRRRNALLIRSLKQQGLGGRLLYWNHIKNFCVWTLGR